MVLFPQKLRGTKKRTKAMDSKLEKKGIGNKYSSC